MVLHRRLWWAVFAVILAFSSILVYVRVNNERAVERDTYETWRETFVVKNHPGATYVNAGTSKHRVAMSEAQGMGMLITARAGRNGWAKQADFDSLLAYYQLHRDGNTYLMSWRQQLKQGEWRNDQNSATDGDLYIAQSLITAAKTWPKAANQYRRLARKIAADILRYEYNDTAKMVTVGNWATSDSWAYNVMRSSDVMPTVFDALAITTGDDRWREISNSMLDKLQTLSDQHQTGLVPDFSIIEKDRIRPAQRDEVSTKADGTYDYNAARVPMMLANATDARARKINDRMIHFFAQQKTLVAGYQLSGQATKTYESSAFQAPIFNLATNATNADAEVLYRNTTNVLNKSVAQQPYYDATITTLVAVGGFKND
ncbi:glycosyl hydrolase family 8 [Weissella confusa]|uniref:glycosyl hydrolase family 8 n=1 Tax=Weissella confusa TaxID=1583 RepID=UPI00280A4F10|nr:glycosyl hydrolase family 8 [Weissella confusa]